MEPNKLQHATVHTSKEPVEFGDGRVAPTLEHLALDVSKEGIVKSLSNMVTILDGLSCWSGVFAFDELAEQIMVLRPLPNSAAIRTSTILGHCEMKISAPSRFG